VGHIFKTDIAPLVFEKLISADRFVKFTTDFSSETKYRGRREGHAVLIFTSTTSKKRKDLPAGAEIGINDGKLSRNCRNYITLFM
jgi:hypothetical protein